jgi:tRNA pseudouridine38-40 synthase
MPRYKLTIEYDGAAFRGWQRQEGVPSVQQSIEDALFEILHQKFVLEGAGRTDAGVHAKGQVGHFEYPQKINTFKLTEGLNFYLRPHITILNIEEVADDFHARFSAKSRAYEYLILNRRAHSPLLKDYAWHVNLPLDVDLMNKGASHFLGTHNFNAFRASECQSSSPIKTLSQFSIIQEGELIKAFIQAPSFLHNQVRIMVGTLRLVGEGKWPPEKIKEIIQRENRTLAGPTAPPHGLCLVSVEY